MTVRRGFVLRLLAGALWLSVAASPGVARAQGMPPPGMARVWFLRLYEPYVSLATPMLYVNGAALVPSEPGTVFHRDFPAGMYTFSVFSEGIDYGREQTIPLVPGGQVYLLVWCDANWASGRTYQRDTFYVVAVPQPLAWQYARLPDMRDLGAR